MAIQVRRGTNAEWENTNQNIVAGEPAVALDSERFFVGTGAGTYAEYANVKSIASAYSTTRAYREGDYVMYNGKLYVCTTATTGGAWNAANWEEASLLDAMTGDIPYRNYETTSVSGDIASFDNGAGGIPVKDLSVDIEAVQDLHGYDAPWAGGAGKNLVYPIMHDSDGSVMNTYTSQGITYTYNSDGSVTAIGTSTAESLSGYGPSATTLAPLRFLPVGTYILSGSFGTNNVTLYAQFRDKSNNVVPVKINGSSYNTVTCRGTKAATFTVETECCAYVRADIMSGETVNGTFYPMIRKSTDSATYEPYENICPISGWDEVNVTRTGKNLLAYPYYDGTSKTSNGITFTVNSDGSIGVNGTATATADFWIRYQNTSKTLPIGTYKYTPSGVNIPTTAYLHARTIKSSTYVNTDVTQEKTFTITEQGDGLHSVSLRVPNGTTITNGIFYPMVVIGSETNTSYEPYIGNTYTTALGSTYYGGTLDVTTGVLTVTHGIVDLGSLTWTYNSTYSLFSATASSDTPTILNSGANDVICEAYKHYYTGAQIVLKNIENGSIVLNTDSFSSSKWWLIKNTDYTDGATLKSSLSGKYAVYPLATPQVVQLTPTQVKTFLRENNIWADSGKIINCTYRITNT